MKMIAGLRLARLGEQPADARRAQAGEHLDERRGRLREELARRTRRRRPWRAASCRCRAARAAGSPSAPSRPARGTAPGSRRNSTTSASSALASSAPATAPHLTDADDSGLICCGFVFGISFSVRQMKTTMQEHEDDRRPGDDLGLEAAPLYQCDSGRPRRRRLRHELDGLDAGRQLEPSIMPAQYARPHGAGRLGSGPHMFVQLALAAALAGARAAPARRRRGPCSWSARRAASCTRRSPPRAPRCSGSTAPRSTSATWPRATSPPRGCAAPTPSSSRHDRRPARRPPRAAPVRAPRRRARRLPLGDRHVRVLARVGAADRRPLRPPRGAGRRRDGAVVAPGPPGGRAASRRRSGCARSGTCTSRASPAGRACSCAGASARRPLVWVRSPGRGRVFYDALGHFPATWQDPRQEALVRSGLRWVLRL